MSALLESTLLQEAKQPELVDMIDGITSVLLPTPEANGHYLCRMTEFTMCQRVASVHAPRVAAAAPGHTQPLPLYLDACVCRAVKIVYTQLWTLICDAKTRKRRPDGTIISLEQEKDNFRWVEEEQQAKSLLWAEREKHLITNFK